MAMEAAANRTDAQRDARAFDMDALRSRLASVDEDEAVLVLQSHLDGNLLDAAEKQRIAPRALCWACERGSERLVGYVLSTGANPNACVDERGRTPLCIASWDGRAEIVRLLLQAQANVDLATKDRRTPLLHACLSGHIEIVRLLVEAGADADLAAKDGRRPLLYACFSGRIEIVRLLLEARATVNLADKNGRTPLYDACSNNHIEVVRLLLEAGADLNLPTSDGRTPLYDVCLYGRVEVARLLLEAGADANLTTKDGRAALHDVCSSGYIEVMRLLLEAQADVNLADQDGRTCLHRACSTGDIEVLQLLLDAQADVELADKDGRTPLHDASSTGDIEIVRLLLEGLPDANLVDKDGRTPLYDACSNKHIEMVRLLLEDGADVNLADKDGRTPLNDACRNKCVEVARLLVDAGADVNLADKDGWTPLAYACLYGRVEIVRRLLEASADVNRTDKDGRTPLYDAATTGHIEVVRLLVEARADVNLVDKDGRSPLHWAQTSIVSKFLVAAGAVPFVIDQHGWNPLHRACFDLRHGTARVLVASSDLLDQRGQDGYQPMHLALFGVWTRGWSTKALETLQVLVENGSEWDSTCDQIVDQAAPWPSSLGAQPSPRDGKKWRQEASAIRLCVERWTEEHRQGFAFTEVPLEAVRSGEDATRVFIREITDSRNLMLRSKICVVGPSSWGKPSLIKSLTTEMPSLVHPDDRTIGIDHFKLVFEEQLQDREGTKKHVVTFWDFAGQDAYQGAHSLFYSARTLYLVCIDLVSYVLARMQAELMTDTESDANRWMNEFVDTRILRWIRVICACQPDAEFVFVATKRDRVVDADLEGDDGVLADLRTRMANVMVIIDEMKQAHDKQAQDPSEEPGSAVHEHDQSTRLPITHLGDPRLATMSMKPSVHIIVTSCTTWESVGTFKEEIEDVIKKSDRGFPMPDKYSLVLKALLRMKEEALASATDKRITETFRAVEDLVQTLVTTIVNPFPTIDQQQVVGEMYLDELTCRVILQTLRDLGDMLWYDAIDDELLKSTVILDPMLMIDLARDIFDHNHTDEVMTHHTLKGLKHWRHLEGTASMLSMKRVMQNFHLVYPTTGEMTATSDLIVPAYWKTNTSAFWMFGGGDLRFGRGVHREDVAIRVHFEFQFVNNFPDTLFDHVVVASYSPFYKRDVGPDWIMYKEDDAIACRLMVGRDHKTHHPLLHLEALQGHPADEDQVEELWDIFTLLAESLEVVIRTYPGVVVCRYVREDTEKDVEQTRYTLETLQKFKLTRASRKWLPPKPTWESYLTFWKG